MVYIVCRPVFRSAGPRHLPACGPRIPFPLPRHFTPPPYPPITFLPLPTPLFLPLRNRALKSSYSGGAPQPKSNLVHFSLKIWHLVATILIIFLRINWPNFVHFVILVWTVWRMAIDDERVPRGDWRDTRLWRYVAGLVIKILYVRERERSLYSIRSLILSQWREARRGVMWQVFASATRLRSRSMSVFTVINTYQIFKVTVIENIDSAFIFSEKPVRYPA